MSITTASGGWCKHGIMEASHCDKCIEEWRAAGLNVQWHEGSIFPKGTPTVSFGTNEFSNPPITDEQARAELGQLIKRLQDAGHIVIVPSKYRTVGGEW